MFCPQCGQQQVSDEVRFCSRCGFPLEGVSALLASGGLVASAQGEPSPRRKGVRQGLMTILFGLLVVPFIAVLSEELHVIPDAFIPLAAVIFFMGGIVRLVYALAFQDGAPSVPAAVHAGAPAHQHLGAGASRGELPPPQSVPAGAYAPPRARTAEIVRPPSVTENTTRLLGGQGRGDDEDPPR